MDINNGLRQGSPLSPVLFNLSVEILALAIRQNPVIEGISIGQTHKKIGQYADNIWAVIKTTRNSYTELLAITGKFAKVSGLKLNYDKTQVMNIGNLTDTDFDPRTFSEKKIQLVKETKILGILVSGDKQHMIRENYKELLNSIKQKLNPWSTRSLTLMGKVVVVNSLIMSLTVHKILCVGSPEKKFVKEVRKLVTEFLWNGK